MATNKGEGGRGENIQTVVSVQAGSTESLLSFLVGSCNIDVEMTCSQLSAVYSPSTLSTSVMVSSPGITEPRPFNNREDGSPPIPLLEWEQLVKRNRQLVDL